MRWEPARGLRGTARVQHGRLEKVRGRVIREIGEGIRAGDQPHNHKALQATNDFTIYTARGGKLLKCFEVQMDIDYVLERITVHGKRKIVPLQWRNRADSTFTT